MTTSDPVTAPVGVEATPVAEPGMGRNSVALAVSALITGVLGLIYWALIGRTYPPREVGAAAAIITTATMLSAFGNLSFGALFERFVPVAGDKLSLLVRTGFATGAGVSAVLAIGFLFLGPTDEMFTGPLDRALFPLVVVAFSVFALLDHTAVGLRQATWAAKKNVAHAVIKSVLVITLAFTASRQAIVWTWVAPALVLALVLAVVVARRIRSRPVILSGEVLPGRRELGTYLTGTYLLYVVGSLAPLLLPLIVISELGAELNAYFAISWSLVTALVVLLTMLMGPYIAAAAADPVGAYALTLRFIMILGAVGLGGAVFLGTAGPSLLSLVGSGYREFGGPVLQLAAVGLALALVGFAYSTVSRLRRRLRFAVAAQCINAALMLGLGVTWVDSDGLEGLGKAFVTAELVTATLVIVPLILALRSLRGPITVGRHRR